MRFRKPFRANPRMALGGLPPLMEAVGASSALVVSQGTTATLTDAFFQNVTGVSVSGRMLTKTAASGWGNSFASSINPITSNTQFSTNEVTFQKMAGLTHTISDSSFDTIDFGIYLAGSTIDIFEDGTEVGISVGTANINDVFEVKLLAGVVTYLKNGTLLYTSLKSPTTPLYFAAAFYNQNAVLTNVGIT